MTGRRAYQVICRTADRIASAAVGFAAGYTLLVFHVVTPGVPGYTAAAALGAAVFLADRWITRNRVFTRWLRPAQPIRWQLETLAGVTAATIGAAVSVTLDGFGALERRIRGARDMRVQRRGSER